MPCYSSNDCECLVLVDLSNVSLLHVQPIVNDVCCAYLITGPTVKFNNIIDTVRAEVATLQGQGINKIIALGHAGYGIDQEVGAIDGVDVVVGGHTDTFLFTG